MKLTSRVCRNHRRGRNREAFTFAEVLAAMVFMAILIPVVLEAITIANRAGIGAIRMNTASTMGNNLLHELILDNQWQNAGGSGDFGTEHPGYKWQLNQASWTEDTMRLLTLEVFYPVQGQERSIVLSTLVDESEE